VRASGDVLVDQPLTLTAICFGFASSLFGSVMVRTPLLSQRPWSCQSSAAANDRLNWLNVRSTVAALILHLRVGLLLAADREDVVIHRQGDVILLHVGQLGMMTSSCVVL
jgi:hypothetical protein